MASRRRAASSPRARALVLALSLALAAAAGCAPLVEVDAEPTSEQQALRFPQSAAAQRVVFWGDSITELGRYVSEIESALALGRHDFRIKFYNAGSGGNTLQTGLLRLYSEVIDADPALVVVQFGTNDGGYRPLDSVRAAFFWGWLDAAVKQIRQHTKARILIVAPPYFDAQQQVVWRGNFPYNAPADYNEVLRSFGAIGHAVSVTHGTLFADPNRVMEQYTQERRREAPYFSLLTDGIHPDERGAIVMALTLLAALTEGRTVWSAKLPADLLDTGGRLAISTPAAIYPLSRCLPRSDVLSPLYRRVLPSLQLRGDAPADADYTLSVGDAVIARFDGAALRAGTVTVDGWDVCAGVDRKALATVLERRRMTIFDDVRLPLQQVKAVRDFREREREYKLAASSARASYELLDSALRSLRRREVAHRVYLRLDRR